MLLGEGRRIAGRRDSMEERIGLIGVGLVGMSLAKRFLERGYGLTVCDLDAERADLAVRLGAQAAASARQVGESCGRVVLSLPSSSEVEQVVCGEDGLLAGNRLPRLIVDTTTSDPLRCANVAERLSERGVSFLDATISGSSQEVLDGGAVLMVGGDAEAVSRNRDLLDCVGSKVYRMGPSGAGARTKLIVNLVLGLNRLALAEGLALAEKGGMDLSVVLDVLKDSAAYSRAMDAKGISMAKQEFAPKARLRQHRKDVGLILEMGRREQARLPVSQLHEQLLGEAETRGWGDEDNAAIIQVFRSVNRAP